MSAKEARRIVLVDDARQGPTAKIIESAVSNSSARHVSSLRVENLTMKEARMADFDPITTTIFVSVSDKVLSVRDDGLRAPRVACESLDLAQGLVQSNPRSRVILVCQAGISAFTALDAVASLLGGMAGLVEDRLLIAEGVLDSVLCLHHLDRKGRLMLMLGESADRLQGIQAMLAEWELDDEADDIVDLKCFRAAMALAQLD